MGSTFSVVSVEANVDTSALARRLLDDPRVQKLLEQHSDLVATLSRTHKDLALSLSQDAHTLTKSYANLALELSEDAHTLTKEYADLARSLTRDTRAVMQAHASLAQTLNQAVWVVAGTIATCGAVYIYRSYRNLPLATQTATFTGPSPTEAKRNDPALISAGDGKSSVPANDDMMEFVICVGGKEHTVKVPLRYMLVPGTRQRTSTKEET